jgi:hypothetical protein
MSHFLAVLALGAFTAFLVGQWERLIGDKDLAFLIGFPALCLIAWLYDRRQAKLQRSNRATTEPEQ